MRDLRCLEVPTGVLHWLIKVLPSERRGIRTSLCTSLIQHPCLCLFSQHLWHCESSSLVAELPVMSFSTTPWHFLQWSFISLFGLTIYLSKLNSSSLPTTPTTSTTLHPGSLQAVVPSIGDGPSAFVENCALSSSTHENKSSKEDSMMQHDLISTSMKPTGRW